MPSETLRLRPTCYRLPIVASYLLAMLFGLIGTSLLHLSKGLQAYGIEALVPSRRKRHRPRNMVKTAYILGFLLNNTYGVWMILSGRFAPASFFTSMYGIGLIVLLLYSHHYLHEPLHRYQILGIGFIIAGTVVLGITGIYSGHLDMGLIDRTRVIIISSGYAFITLTLLLLSRLLRRKSLFGVALGIFTGGVASLEPIYKGIGQSLGGAPGFIPSTSLGWLFFLISFAFGFFAFMATQYGFAKGVKASVLVPMHNSIFVALPILIQSAALPGFRFTPLMALGLFLVGGGTVISSHGERLGRS